MGIVLVSLISSMYAGECLEVDLSELESLNIVYTVVGNSSNLEGLTINLNETTKIASICTVINYKPDNFTIIFIDNLTKVIVKEVPVYRGGGGIKYVDKEVYIEVPNYIDRETIKEIEVEIEVKGETIKEVPIWSWIVLGILILLVLLALSITIPWGKSNSSQEENIIKKEVNKNVKFKRNSTGI